MVLVVLSIAVIVEVRGEKVISEEYTWTSEEDDAIFIYVHLILYRWNVLVKYITIFADV